MCRLKTRTTTVNKQNVVLDRSFCRNKIELNETIRNLFKVTFLVGLRTFHYEIDVAKIFVRQVIRSKSGKDQHSTQSLK